MTTYEAAIKAVTKEVPQHGLQVTVTKKLDDYLSCELQVNAAQYTAWLGQPHMVKKIKKVFGEMTSNMMKYQTPGTPNHGLILAKDQKDKLDPERHSLF